MAESGDGELNKAITFVLQQCLQQPDAAQKDDQNLCDEIARVEGLLAEEDQDMSPFRQLNESQQNKVQLKFMHFSYMYVAQTYHYKFLSIPV